MVRYTKELLIFPLLLLLYLANEMFLHACLYQNER